MDGMGPFVSSQLRPCLALTRSSLDIICLWAEWGITRLLLPQIP